jgi:hypothetical protein
LNLIIAFPRQVEVCFDGSNRPEQFKRALPACGQLRSVHEMATHFSDCNVDVAMALRLCGKSISQRQGRQAGLREISG